MGLSDDLAKIHRWLLSRPTFVYGLLVAIYSVGWVLALLLALVPEPFYGNRVLWAADVVLLTGFGISHLRYRR